MHFTITWNGGFKVGTDGKLQALNFFYVPATKGWGHIAFGADPVEIRVTSCLHSIS